MKGSGKKRKQECQDTYDDEEEEKTQEETGQDNKVGCSFVLCETLRYDDATQVLSNCILSAVINC